MRPCVQRISCVLLALLGCGCAGRAKQAKVAPPTSSYDWSDYKGTFAATAHPPPEPEPVKPSPAPKAGPTAKEAAPSRRQDAPRSEPAKPPEPPKKEVAKPSVPDQEQKEASAPPSTASAAASAKRSGSKIHGESVSSVNVDDVAAASATVLKTKVLAKSITVGKQYEQLVVVFKNAAVQIVRPAASPDPAGPNVRSPKVRKSELAKTESGFYDDEADVLVLVQSKKKASSVKALFAILER